MSPNNSLVTGYTISGLPAVVTAATELPGGLFEVEILVGPPGGLQAYMNKRLTAEQLLDYMGAQGSSPDYTALELAPDRHLFADEELTTIQQALDDGSLVWIYDDGSGLRQQVTAGTSPTQTPAQNSAALIQMAAGLPQP